jgi:hypothetical protein
LPASVAKPPIIGVAAGPLSAVCLLVAGAPVDDCEVVKDTDDHVVLTDALDRRTATDLRKKGLALDEGAVRVGVEKSLARLASNYVGFIHGTDVVAI